MTELRELKAHCEGSIQGLEKFKDDPVVGVKSTAKIEAYEDMLKQIKMHMKYVR